jgi:hypothetical protein
MREILLIVEFEAVLCALSIIAILPILVTLNRPSPQILWVLLLVYAAFFVAWGLAWRGRKRPVGVQNGREPTAGNIGIAHKCLRLRYLS